MRKNWEISKLATPEYAPEFSVYSVESGKDVARVIGNDSEENVKLIAAAPDLLAALQELQANPNDPRAHRAAMDAIAKAKG